MLLLQPRATIFEPAADALAALSFNPGCTESIVACEGRCHVLLAAVLLAAVSVAAVPLHRYTIAPLHHYTAALTL